MKKIDNYFSRVLCALFLCAASVVTSCYDDSALQEDIQTMGDLLEDHEARLKELERLVAQQNTNILSLQTIVEALQENDYVTNVAPIKEGDEVVGYTITFSKSGSVTIYNGEDGYDPVIGVRQAADNLWYWTVDGEWLLDSNGDKVRASAADGKDGLDGEDGKNGEDGKDGEQGPAGQPGVTPLLKIVDGYWYVSYDGGKTWEDEPLGQATGDKCCTMFADVTYDEDYLYLTMADGTVISLPVAETALTIVPESDVVLVNSQKHTFEIEVKGAAEGVEIDYILEDDSWSVTHTMMSDGKYMFDISAPSVASSTKLMIFASSDNGFAMHKVTLTRERELMLSLNNADYDSYSFHITVPETVLESNNHVRFYALTLPQYNYWKITEGKCDDDLIKWMLSDSMRNSYRAEYVTEDNDINISHENEGYYSNCYPGCPMVAFACEFTPDGQPVGNSAMLEFKLKEPSRLNASVEIEVSDITSYDAEITIAPTNLSVRQCKMYILTDEDYGKYLDYLGGAEELLPWSVYSQYDGLPGLYFEKEYLLVYDLDVTRISVSSLLHGPSYIKPDTKYHILVAGLSLDDCVVRSVTFTHETFTTSKSQRTQAPEIIVSPLVDETTPNMAVFNVRCTSYDDVSYGPVFRAKYCFRPYREVESVGYPIEEWASDAFDSEQLAAINSPSGLTVQIPCIDGERYAFFVSAQNDEQFSNELSLEGCPAFAELTTPFLKKPYVSSELLTEDVLEGEWLMSAKDLSGENVEATVRILRGYQEGRDYPSGCPDEFLEQVEIFNQKRLTDKNSLLLQGWFSADPYGTDLVRTPYDLLMATDYVAYDYPQLFMDAGPKMLLEVDASGNLKITVNTNCTISASTWARNYHYVGLSKESLSENMEFPVELSEDKRTMTINPVDGYYLNMVYLDNWGGPDAFVRVNSQITLIKQ